MNILLLCWETEENLVLGQEISIKRTIRVATERTSLCLGATDPLIMDPPCGFLAGSSFKYTHKDC